jgi:hypothetical protein
MFLKFLDDLEASMRKKPNSTASLPAHHRIALPLARLGRP